jgi:hypothetical protein
MIGTKGHGWAQQFSGRKLWYTFAAPNGAYGLLGNPAKTYDGMCKATLQAQILAMSFKERALDSVDV